MRGKNIELNGQGQKRACEDIEDIEDIEDLDMPKTDLLVVTRQWYN